MCEGRDWRAGARCGGRIADGELQPTAHTQPFQTPPSGSASSSRSRWRQQPRSSCTMSARAADRREAPTVGGRVANGWRIAFEDACGRGVSVAAPV